MGAMFRARKLSKLPIADFQLVLVGAVNFQGDPNNRQLEIGNWQ
jgi:hypothetical protein